MISCLHDHFLDDQLLSTPHLYFLYLRLEWVLIHRLESVAANEIKVSVWRGSLESHGNSSDLFVNGGGQQAVAATLNRL